MNKVLILNGSPHQHGCTATALDEMIKVFEEEGVGTELIQVGTKDIKKDLEGLQTMRNLARNMSFMIKAFSDAKVKYGYPEVERGCFTSFPDGK
jgi:ssDNA-specific exonuclease RecJ